MAWLLVVLGLGVVILGLARLRVRAQREPAEPPRPPGLVAAGRFAVARLSGDNIILLDTATGDLYLATPDDFKKYAERPTARAKARFGKEKARPPARDKGRLNKDLDGLKEDLQKEIQKERDTLIERLRKERDDLKDRLLKETGDLMDEIKKLQETLKEKIGKEKELPRKDGD
jgi:hypothetical protein